MVSTAQRWAVNLSLLAFFLWGKRPQYPVNRKRGVCTFGKNVLALARNQTQDHPALTDKKLYWLCYTAPIVYAYFKSGSDEKTLVYKPWTGICHRNGCHFRRRFLLFSTKFFVLVTLMSHVKMLHSKPSGLTFQCAQMDAKNRPSSIFLSANDM
jgi:hypothetical protein